MGSKKILPQSFSAAFFLGMLFLFLSGVCHGAMDTLVVEAYGNPGGNGVMVPAVKQKSLVGVWNLEFSSKVGRAGQPVVVWFHGGMTSGNCAKGVVAGGDLAKMLPGHIVISASACKENHWVTPLAVGWIESALDSVGRRRGLPVERISLVGISDGALGVLAYSVWGRRQVTSRLLMSSYGASFGDAAEIAGLSQVRTGRWRFVQGGADRLYPADATVPWITRFCDVVGQSRGTALCDLKFDPAGEHDWSYWKERHSDWIMEVFKEK